MSNKKKYRVTTPMPPLPELLGGTELSLFDQTNNDINLFNLVGHYNPTVLEETLSEFGLEIQNEQIFIFNKSYIEQKLHEEPKAGDVIKPRFQNQKYEIYEVQEDSYELYGVYHMACSAKLLRDTEAILDEDLDERTDNLGGYLNLGN